ncbi:MAG: tRNA uridine-5-carboxymethylaminomethyl(34) synthesis GTPase MnmE [Alphaproteobacteria bacterium]
MAEDTIFAVSSGAGLAGVAVIRLSGERAGPALAALTGRDCPAPRRARLDRIRQPDTGEVIDQALTLWFPGPGSFTGEDCAEIQGHGGRATLAATLAALAALPGLRAAEPGEFTRRAVLNGRMDMTQAEGLLDLIHAETDGQRRQALAQTEGALGRLIGGWRDRLIRMMAHGEAEIDFPDEGDAPDRVLAHLGTDLTGLIAEMDRHLSDPRRGERLRDGVSVVILGAPNAGKSTLLNLLARRDVAIVSPEPGTTRDVVDVALDLGGVPVRVADTAGLRETIGAVEREGIRRAVATAEAADLRIFVVDGTGGDSGLSADRTALVDHWREGDCVLLNKSDRLDPAALRGAVAALSKDGPWTEKVIHAVSAETGDGLDRVLSVLTDRMRTIVPVATETPLTRLRHREALEDCVGHLRRALDGMRVGAGAPELLAEDLRLAMRALGRITGAVDVEDLLDIVFRDFCIGK